MMASETSAKKRYYRRAAIGMTIYLLAMFGGSKFASMNELTDGGAIIAALIPSMAILWMFYAMARYLVEQPDEFMKALMVRQLLVSIATVMAAATVWGFLEFFGVVPSLPAYWVLLAWVTGMFIGTIVNKVTMGSWGPLW